MICLVGRIRRQIGQVLNDRPKSNIPNVFTGGVLPRIRVIRIVIRRLIRGNFRIQLAILFALGDGRFGWLRRRGKFHITGAGGSEVSGFIDACKLHATSFATKTVIEIHANRTAASNVQAKRAGRHALFTLNGICINQHGLPVVFKMTDEKDLFAVALPLHVNFKLNLTAVGANVCRSARIRKCVGLIPDGTRRREHAVATRRFISYNRAA
jgi:hypothetical protein